MLFINTKWFIQRIIIDRTNITNIYKLREQLKTSIIAFSNFILWNIMTTYSLSRSYSHNIDISRTS